MFLSKKLYSHSDSLHPGVRIGTGKFNVRRDILATEQHIIQTGVELN